MAECIEREALLEALENADPDVYEDYGDGTVDWGFGRKNIQDMINGIPAADVAPVVHGRWLHSRYEDCSEQFKRVKCSQCNQEAYAMAFYVVDGNYCPKCGAKMDGGTK
jgi:hypothetical protein